MSIIHQGNRTEIELLRSLHEKEDAQLLNARSSLVASKRLREFANVKPERRALFVEAFLHHAARGRGVVPLVLSEELEIALGEHKERGGCSQNMNELGTYCEVSEFGRLYIQGETLDAYLFNKQLRAVSLPVMMGWLAELCDVLKRVHSLKIIHRDVTPSNILFGTGGDSDSRVWLNDFSLARSLKSGALKEEELLQGTPRFLVPEVLRGEQPSSASDIYQVGLLLALAMMNPSQRGEILSAPGALRSLAPQYLKSSGLGEILAEEPLCRPDAGELARLLRR